MASRNGGRKAYTEKFKFLYSKEKLDSSSSVIWTTSWEFPYDSDGTPNHHGRYYNTAYEVLHDAIAELQMLIDKYGFPTLSLHSEAFVIESLFQNVCEEEQMTREKYECFMTKPAFEALCKQVGFHLALKYLFLVDDEYVLDECHQGETFLDIE